MIFPDIVFTAEDVGLVDGYVPALLSRSDTSNWQNNDAINGQDADLTGGPGVIEGPVFIRFSDQLPFLINSTSFFVGGTVPGSLGTQDSALFGNLVWGSFDGTTAEPVIYPQFGAVTLQYLRQFVVGGGN